MYSAVATVIKGSNAGDSGPKYGYQSNTQQPTSTQQYSKSNSSFEAGYADYIPDTSKQYANSKAQKEWESRKQAQKQQPQQQYQQQQQQVYYSPPPTAVQSTPSSAAAKKFCGSCGSQQHSANVRFCGSCGKQI